MTTLPPLSAADLSDLMACWLLVAFGASAIFATWIMVWLTGPLE